MVIGKRGESLGALIYRGRSILRYPGKLASRCRGMRIQFEKKLASASPSAFLEIVGEMASRVLRMGCNDALISAACSADIDLSDCLVAFAFSLDVSSLKDKLVRLLYPKHSLFDFWQLAPVD